LCPDAVNAILKEAKGIAPMTWKECEQHNLKFYQEVFIVPEFRPQKFGELNTLLQKMERNPFIREFHFEKASVWPLRTSNWKQWQRWVADSPPNMYMCQDFGMKTRMQLLRETEKGFVSYRSQIKQGIESAKQPTVGITF
jgi:hypothetical protein